MKRVPAVGEQGAQAVAEVGGGGDPLQRRRRLAGHDRRGQPEPHRRRTDARSTDPAASRISNARPNPISGRSPHPASDGSSTSGRLSAGPGKPGRCRGRRPQLERRDRSAAAARSPARAPCRPSSPRSPGVLVSDASSHCTLRPGRIVRTCTSSGASGTGRSSSIVRRVTKFAGPGSWRSTARASSAAGAPPCIACGDHGPRASPVGTARSPSRWNTASGRSTMSLKTMLPRPTDQGAKAT